MSLAALPSLIKKSRKITSTSVLYVVFFFCVKESRRSMKLISVLSGNGFVMYNKELAHTVSVNGAIILDSYAQAMKALAVKVC